MNSLEAWCAGHKDGFMLGASLFDYDLFDVNPDFVERPSYLTGLWDGLEYFFFLYPSVRPAPNSMVSSDEVLYIPLAEDDVIFYQDCLGPWKNRKMSFMVASATRSYERYLAQLISKINSIHPNTNKCDELKVESTKIKARLAFWKATATLFGPI